MHLPAIHWLQLESLQRYVMLSVVLVLLCPNAADTVRTSAPLVMSRLAFRRRYGIINANKDKTAKAVFSNAFLYRFGSKPIGGLQLWYNNDKRNNLDFQGVPTFTVIVQFLFQVKTWPENYRKRMLFH